jgi:hypothetical protein
MMYHDIDKESLVNFVLGLANDENMDILFSLYQVSQLLIKTKNFNSVLKDFIEFSFGRYLRQQYSKGNFNLS